MKDFKYIWLVGLIVTILIVVTPILSVVSITAEAEDDPWAYLPVREPHVDHVDLLPGPYETGQDVTRACLECHENAAHEMVQTVQWTAWFAMNRAAPTSKATPVYHQRASTWRWRRKAWPPPPA